jgi:uncharacterized membrane protein YgdD (TMEM256/DUF423 family)
MVRNWSFLGAAFGAVAVATGAFGAHGLKDHLSAEALAWWQTAAPYQLAHALALVAVGLVAERRPSKAIDVAGAAFALGIVLFSGSLYALALSGVRALGAITPIGGVLLLAGWVALAVATRRPRPSA